MTGLCTVCGKPMPKGEEMFKFHGYSGPCPAEPMASRQDINTSTMDINAALEAISELARTDASNNSPNRIKEIAYRALSSLSRIQVPDLKDEVLEECAEYLENRADADCDQDGFIPNKEMLLLSRVREAINKSTS